MRRQNDLLFRLEKLPHGGGDITFPELLSIKVRLVDRKTKQSAGKVPLSMLLKKLG